MLSWDGAGSLFDLSNLENTARKLNRRQAKCSQHYMIKSGRNYGIKLDRKLKAYWHLTR